MLNYAQARKHTFDEGKLFVYSQPLRIATLLKRSKRATPTALKRGSFPKRVLEYKFYNATAANERLL